VQVVEIQAGGRGSEGLAPARIVPAAALLLVGAVQVREKGAQLVQAARRGALAPEKPQQFVRHEPPVGEGAVGELTHLAVQAPPEGVLLQVGEGESDLGRPRKPRTVAL